ncbi:lysophospholipid acyltransferase family protein [Reinekea marina]|uniref:Lysophospholipid acyltransferase family protein n=1 Tax=Reinekea marina TaxID=1310421 RepID=A0ABV7WPD0_9GAMM|nr:lysophospholipid acyltransferase family protein [Reinekea marina]MDN3648626.1 lysophospholipid acyltransferase family protein [Reinekea marina]
MTHVNNPILNANFRSKWYIATFLTGFVQVLMLVLKFIRILLLVFVLLFGVFLIIIATTIDSLVGKKWAQLWVSKLWFRSLLVVMNVHVTRIGEVQAGGTLVASNHISWLDIPVLGSVLPCYFLSKAEVKNIPVVGWLAHRGGTLFIKRGSGQIEQVRSLMKVYLDRDHCLSFFPEATTGDGFSIRQFHPRLFAAAIDSDVPVMPVAISYQLHRQSSIEIGFGDETMAANIWRVLGRWRTDATVQLLPVVQTRDLERKSLADTCMHSIADAINIPHTHRGVGFKAPLPDRHSR